MARIKFAIQKNIAAGSSDPAIVPVGIILHVAASWGLSLFSFFRYRSGGIESHFYIRKDGTVEQYRDTGREADANRFANSFVRGGRRLGFISIETEGLGGGEWTPAQLAAIKRLLVELRELHPTIPWRRCPGWDQGGIGFHTMWGSPSKWTPVAKSCPGPKRIRQFNDILVPWINSAHAPKPAPVKPAPKPAPAQKPPAAPGVPSWVKPDGFGIGRRGAQVTWLGQRLVAHGFTRHRDGAAYTPGPTFTRFDQANVAEFQRAQGWTGRGADGLPGVETLRRLAATPHRR